MNYTSRETEIRMSDVKVLENPVEKRIGEITPQNM